jgi:hypothetical protein
MRVTNDVIENAVLQIFIDMKIAAGGRLLSSDLRRQWSHTHLRQGDLIQGVKRLLFNGCLELVDNADDAIMVLTDKGAECANALPSGPRGTWNHFVSMALLNLVRRDRTSPARSLGRRTTDVHHLFN